LVWLETLSWASWGVTDLVVAFLKKVRAFRHVLNCSKIGGQNSGISNGGDTIQLESEDKPIIIKRKKWVFAHWRGSGLEVPERKVENRN
jgi:hypothetical protein